MKLFTLTYLALSTLAFGAAQPENVTAVWHDGAIEVSWDRPVPPPTIVHIQRRRDGTKDASFEVTLSDLALIAGRPERSVFTDTAVALNFGTYSYKVKFGKSGPWSSKAVEQNKPQSNTGPRQERNAPQALMLPVVPPPTPEFLGAVPAPGGTLIRWRVAGNSPPGQLFPVDSFDLIRITPFGPPNTLQQGLKRTTVASYPRVSYVTYYNQTTYEMLDPDPWAPGSSYQVRSVSKVTADLSPWSPAVAAPRTNDS